MTYSSSFLLLSEVELSSSLDSFLVLGNRSTLISFALTVSETFLMQCPKKFLNTILAMNPSSSAFRLGLESVRYGVSNVLDTAYWGFLGVGTTFDIFQNIHILYLQYGVLVFSGYGVLIMFPLWSLVSAGTDTPYLP
ncbi:hypothetical protein Tco_0901590 [Tanacetum coccineum]